MRWIRSFHSYTVGSRPADAKRDLIQPADTAKRGYFLFQAELIVRQADRLA